MLGPIGQAPLQIQAEQLATVSRLSCTVRLQYTGRLWIPLVAVHTGRTDWGKVVLQVSTPSCTNSSWICCVDRGLSVQNKALLTSMQGPPRAWDPLTILTLTRHKLPMTNWLPRLRTAHPQESKPTSHKLCTRAGPSGSSLCTQAEPIGARPFCKSPHRAAQTAHGFAAWTADSRRRTKPC